MREYWREEDWPADDHDVDLSRLPIIDPDLWSETDFYKPWGRNSAYRLWTKRREWVRERLSGLSDSAGKPLELAQMLNLMLQPIAYPPDPPEARVELTPWPALPDWKVIFSDLETGSTEKIEQRQAEISELHLSVEDFRYLYLMRGKVEQKETITEEEWQQARDILIQVQKQIFYETWQKEETSLEIKLSPPFFYLTSQKQTLNLPGASATVRSIRLAELQRNSAGPPY